MDATHEDLQGRVLLPGYNAIDGSTDTHDGFGHGTHTSGIAAATYDNGIGIAGVAGPANVKIMPVKVLDDNGSGSDFSVARGIRWSADHGAQVIRMGCGERPINGGTPKRHTAGAPGIGSEGGAREVRTVRRL